MITAYAAYTAAVLITAGTVITDRALRRRRPAARPVLAWSYDGQEWCR